jgi:opacity protein-like surface antigen
MVIFFVNKLLSFSILSVSLLSSFAHADSGIYTSLKAGVSDTKYKNSVDYYVDESGQVDNASTFNVDQSKTIYPEIAAAVGFDFSKISNVNARVELEYTYKDSTNFDPESYAYQQGTQSGAQSGTWYNNKLQSQALMVNGYYDFKNESKFTPYVSAGAGVTRVKNTKTDLYLKNTWCEGYVEECGVTKTDTDTNFTWSVGAGVAYDVTKNVALDLSYRYVDAGKYNFYHDIDDLTPTNKTYSDVKLSSNEYLLGLRYTF